MKNDDGTKILLTAEWKYLAMLNYEVAPEILAPFVPAGTELDVWNGKHYVSVVGFMFLNTRVRHRNSVSSKLRGIKSALLRSTPSRRRLATRRSVREGNRATRGYRVCGADVLQRELCRVADGSSAGKIRR